MGGVQSSNLVGPYFSGTNLRTTFPTKKLYADVTRIHHEFATWVEVRYCDNTEGIAMGHFDNRWRRMEERR